MRNKLLNKLWLRVGMIVAVMTTALSSTAWAESYTITFNAQGLGDGTSVTTSTDCSAIVSEGASYLSGKVAQVTSAYYNGQFGLKLGKSGSAGLIKLNLTNSVTPTTIVVSAKRYSSSKPVTLSVNGSTAQDLTTNFSDYTYDINEEISYIQLNSSNYSWIKSITINYSSGGTPTPSITVAPTTIEAPAEGKEGTIEVTYNNITEVVSDIMFCDADGNETTYDWIYAETNDDNNVDYLIDANEGAARTTYLKVYALDDNANDVYSELITITQAAYVAPIADYATLPFVYDGTGNANDLAAGLTQNGIDKSYSSSPKIQFNTSNDYLLLRFNERPGKLTFDIKGNSFSGGTFKVQTSADGVTYTDLETYTELASTVQSEEFKNLDADVRFIKWVYTEKVNGNVALGNITLAKYETIVNVGTLANVESVEMWDVSMQTIEDGEEVATGTEVFVRPIAAEGYIVEAVTVVDENNNTVEVTENSDSWSFIMPNSCVTINVSATESPVIPIEGDKYVKVTSTSDLTDGQYLIVYEGGNVAFNGGLQTMDAISNTINVTIVNNEIAVSETTRAAEVTIAAIEGGYSIYSTSGKYIYHTGSNNTLNTSDDAQANVITFNDGNVFITVGSYSMYFNKTSGQTRFRYFKNAQEAIQLYKFVADTPAPEYESVSVGDLKYSTYASDKALDFTGSSIKAFYPTVDGSTLIFHEITKVPADTGVLLYSANGAITEDILVCTGETVAAENNVFVRGTGASVTYNDATHEYFYVLSKPQGDNLGFYKANNNKVATNRAYIRVPAELSGAKSFTINLEDDPTGIVNLNDNVNANEGAIYNLAGQRLSKMQKGINIINGKKVLK